MSDTPTPRTSGDDRSWPLPEYAQQIQFEGCAHVVLAPEDYEALFKQSCQLERELAAVTKEKKEAIEARNVIAKNIRGEMILKMQGVAKERDEARAEVARLKAGGCARDQRTTQFCAEAVALQERVKRLEEVGDEMAVYEFIPDRLTEKWTKAKDAKL